MYEQCCNARQDRGMISTVRKNRLKRVLDVLGASFGIIMLSPVFLVAAFAVWLDDRTPVFYCQTRVGQNGRPFRIIKFRSMHRNADEARPRLSADKSDDITFKMKNDPRVTRVGKIIRKFSIDELPQLYNVLRGEMSLVGPRPALPAEVALYTAEQRRRLTVRPGLTCLWQIKGRSDLDFDQQVAMDVEYIATHSLGKDLGILARTFIAVLAGRGAY